MKQGMRKAQRLQMDCRPTAIGLHFDCTPTANRLHFDCTKTAIGLHADRSSILDCAIDGRLCPVRSFDCRARPRAAIGIRFGVIVATDISHRHFSQSAAVTPGNRRFLQEKILFRRYPSHFCGGDEHISFLTRVKMDSRETLHRGYL
jgi:hypothetical protein